jgi:uncharacterized protein (TIGR02466 family)
MSRRAPTCARELFGAYADGPRRVTPDRIDVVASNGVRRVFGPFERWDADELGKTLCVYVYDGLCVDDDALVALAMAARQNDSRRLCVSNIGGFHSTPDVFEREGSATRALAAFAERACARAWTENDAKTTFVKSMMGRGDPGKVSTSWINVCERTGDGHGLHNHVNAIWSGVYYACAGDRDASADDEDVDEPGDLLLRVSAGGVDPTAQADTGYCTYTCVKPRRGRLVVFPSWVLHGVLASAGGAPRVSFAFNTGETEVKFD